MGKLLGVLLLAAVGQAFPQVNQDANLDKIRADTQKTLADLNKQTLEAIKQYESEDFPYPAAQIAQYQNQAQAVVDKYRYYPKDYTYNAAESQRQLETIQAEAQATLDRINKETLAAIQSATSQGRKRRSPQQSVAEITAETQKTLAALNKQTVEAIKKYENEDFPYPAAQIQEYQAQAQAAVNRFANYAKTYKYDSAAEQKRLQQIQAENQATLNRLNEQSLAAIQRYRRSAQNDYVPEDAASVIKKYQDQNAATIAKYTNYEYKYDPNQEPEYSFESQPIDPEGFKKLIKGLKAQTSLINSISRLTNSGLFGKQDSANSGCSPAALGAFTDKLAETLEKAEPQITSISQRTLGAAGSNGNVVRSAAVAFEDISALIPELTSALSVDGCGVAEASAALSSSDFDVSDEETQEGLKKAIGVTRTITRIAAAANGATLTTLCSDDPEFTNSVLGGTQDILTTFGDLFADFGDAANAANLQRTAATLQGAAPATAYAGQPTCETPVSDVSAVLNDIADLVDQTPAQPAAVTVARRVPAPASAYAPQPAPASPYARQPVPANVYARQPVPVQLPAGTQYLG